MTDDSTQLLSSTISMNMVKPRRATINFIRQFAKACTSISGLELNTFVAN